MKGGEGIKSKCRTAPLLQGHVNKHTEVLGLIRGCQILNTVQACDYSADTGKHSREPIRLPI